MTEIQENMLLYYLGNGIVPTEATDGLLDICTAQYICDECPFFKVQCRTTENFITSADLEKFLEKHPEYNIII